MLAPCPSIRADSIPVVTEYSRENLLAMLRSADPTERDEVAYLALAHRIGSGAEDGDLVALGDEVALRLKDPEIQTRTFAALILAEVVERDTTCGACLPPGASACWRRPATSSATRRRTGSPTRWRWSCRGPSLTPPTPSAGSRPSLTPSPPASRARCPRPPPTRCARC